MLYSPERESNKKATQPVPPWGPQSGEGSRGASALCTHYLCSKPPAQPPAQPPAEPQYTHKVLIVSPSQNGPSREKTLWPQTLYKEHFFPTNTAQRNQEHSTIGIHFIIVDFVLGPLRPFVVLK